MGLLRASLIFILGNFSISVIDKHLNKVHQIPVLGPFFGDEIKKKIIENKQMVLLIIITLIEFIL